VAEVIIYGRELDEVEQHAVGHYLAKRYNIDSDYQDPSGARMLIVDANPYFTPADRLTPSAGIHNYMHGTTVELSAAATFTNCPDVYEFSHWTVIDANSVASDIYEPVIDVLMDGNIMVTANYAISTTSQCVSLTIETNPVGLEALVTPAAGQTYEFAMGETVSLSALEHLTDCPNRFDFAGWTGNVEDPEASSTTITLNGNETVVANYADVRACGDVCHPFPEGDLNRDCEVTLDDFAVIAQNWLACTTPACD
jgi:hypothetical protein